MNPTRYSRLFVVLVLTGLVSGCLAASQPFEDDFSDPASGWGAASHETYVRGYQQGRYLFQIDVPRWFVWATSGRKYSDVEVEAVARAAGQPDNHFGLICRYDEEQFYYFAISADGYYAIFYMDEEGDLVPLTGTAMLRSPAIHTDGTDNRIVAVCEATSLTLEVNGELMAQVEDDRLASGDVGMGAGSVSVANTSIWFDDFEVRRP
ncbi:MAG: hypothetical protein ACP5JG_09490 [Anaerolineae bacterium]